MIIRSTLFTIRGGDTIQAIQTARLMNNHGITVDLKLTNERIDYSKYNLLHFFNITRPADILYHIRKAGLPFVISTILINYSEYDKYYRKGLAGMLFRHLPADAIEYIKAIARYVMGRDNMMSITYLIKGQKNSILEILNKARLLMPNSTSEYKRLQKTYSCRTNYLVVPNGVDTDLFRFNRNAKKDPELVLCVARIEGIKNQLNLIQALNNTAFRLIIIGAPSTNQYSYYRACRKIASGNVSFIEHISQEKLVAYYQQAKVHVLPSWFETTGLSSLEAAVMGCNIVITEKGDTREYFGEHAVYCNPESPESIYIAVKEAASLPLNENFRSNILNRYTWQKASQFTAEGYKRIIEKT